MNTKHVPNLELCQEFDRLCKEKGIVVPGTEYVWLQTELKQWEIEQDVDPWCLAERQTSQEGVAAPLVSEHGEWLNKQMATAKSDDALMQSLGADNGFIIWLADINHHDYPTIDSWIVEFLDTTEANARQKMLNYLIAEGIITKL